MTQQASAVRAGAEDGQGVLRRLLRCAWSTLPVLLVSGAAVCVLALLVVLGAGGITPIALLLEGLVVGPLFGALVAQVDDALSKRIDPPVFSLRRYLRRSWKLGMGLGTAVGASLALLLVALEVFVQTRNTLMLISAIVCGSVAVLSGVVYTIGVPLGLNLPGLSRTRLVVLSLHIAARRPVPLLAVLSLVVVIAVLSAQFSAALMFLLPGPLALLIVVAAWSSFPVIGLHPPEPAPTDAR